MKKTKHIEIDKVTAWVMAVKCENVNCIKNAKVKVMNGEKINYYCKSCHNILYDKKKNWEDINKNMKLELFNSSNNDING